MIKLYLKDKPFRILTNSNILNSIGDYIFTITFIIYAAHIENYSKIATSLASISILIPSALNIFLGKLADKTTNHINTLILNKIYQIFCFIIVTCCLCGKKNILNFLIVFIFNLISEIFGSYSNLVELKLFKINVSTDNMNNAMSLTQGLMSFINIISQTYGAILITTMNYHYFYIGIINIITFITALLVLLTGKKYIRDNRQNFPTKDNKYPHILPEIKKIPHFISLILIISVINMLIGSISSVQNVYFLKSKNMWINTYGLTIAIFNMVFTLGMLVGTMTPNDKFKNMRLEKITFILMINLLTVSLIYTYGNSHLKYILLILTFALSFLAGKISPRFSSFIINSLPKHIISSAIGILNTLLTVGTPIGTGVLLLIYNIFNSAKLIWIIISTISIIFIALLLKISKDNFTIF